jgi:hypothetical protein
VRRRSAEPGDDVVLVATMNLPGRPMNVVTDALMAGIAAAVARLAESGVKGLVLVSGKADFCADGDIDRMSRWTTPQEPFEASMATKRVLRQLETQGKPVVAAIAGHALGGGLKLALARHDRIVLEDARIKLGQPEVKLGLLPGGGGAGALARGADAGRARLDRRHPQGPATLGRAEAPLSRLRQSQPGDGAAVGHRSGRRLRQGPRPVPGGTAHHERGVRGRTARLRRRQDGGEPLLRGLLHVARVGQSPRHAEGRPWAEHPGMAVARALCERSRVGRKAGRGFCDYDDAGGGRRLWPGLSALFPPAPRQPPLRGLVDRLLFVQAVEAARCLEDGVLRSAADGNVDSIPGWGFAPRQGGTLRLIDAMGATAFAACAWAEDDQPSARPIRIFCTSLVPS